MLEKDIDNVFVKYVKEYQGRETFFFIYTSKYNSHPLDINGTHVHVYPKPPTALEFLRTSVHPNRPALVQGERKKSERYTKSFIQGKS